MNLFQEKPMVKKRDRQIQTLTDMLSDLTYKIVDLRSEVRVSMGNLVEREIGSLVDRLDQRLVDDLERIKQVTNLTHERVEAWTAPPDSQKIHEVIRKIVREAAVSGLTSTNYRGELERMVMQFTCGAVARAVSAALPPPAAVPPPAEVPSIEQRCQFKRNPLHGS